MLCWKFNVYLAVYSFFPGPRHQSVLYCSAVISGTVCLLLLFHHCLSLGFVIVELCGPVHLVWYNVGNACVTDPFCLPGDVA